MALVFMDGFDHYNEIREKWIVANSFDNPTFTEGRFGGKALKKQFQNAAGSISTHFAPRNEIFVGLAFYAPALANNPDSQWEFIGEDGSRIAVLMVNNDGSVTLNPDGSASSVTTAVGLIDQQQWHYIEIHCNPDPVNGVLELRIDEVVQAVVTGSTSDGHTTVAAFQLGSDSTNSPRFLTDDLYICDGTGTRNSGYLGDVRVTTLHTDGYGTTDDFAPTGKSDSWDAVSEGSMDSDATYVSSGQNLAEADYTVKSLADLGQSPSHIYGVQVCNASRKTDTGTIRYTDDMVIEGVRYTNGTENDTGSVSYFFTEFITDQSPLTGEDYLIGDVQDINVGFTITYREL